MNLVWAVVLALLAVSAYAGDFDAYREALIAGDEARIAALIARDGKRLPVDAGGVTVLHRALHIYSERRIAIVERLISAGVDVNVAAQDGRTPLHWAAGFDVPAAIPLLLRAGANVHARDAEGNTPLFVAGPDAASMLIAAGADVHARNREGNVPLHRNFHAALLAPGVNVRNAAGLTPLHYAALGGNARAIEWLLAQGADPNLRTSADTYWRASHMSREFGPGDRIPAGSRALDLARSRHSTTRWNTSRYEEPVKILRKVTR
jgi:ankyrin repeat protein